MTQAWAHIEVLSARVTLEFPDAVFIGGVAVFYHARSLGSAFAEASHDADLYLSILGKAEMRDRYEMARNERLGKDSVLIDGEDFDVYVEHQHRLAVPYDMVRAYASEVDGVRIASLEHLLVLKLDAAIDRSGTAKGQKDLRDLVRILALLTQPRQELIERFLTDERLETLQLIERRPTLYAEMRLNAHEASRIQRVIHRNVMVVRSLARPKGPTIGGI